MIQSYPNLLLQNVEVQELTGFKLPSRQVQWLHAGGWIYETDRHGRPRIARSYFDARMSGQTSSGRRDTPRVEFLFQ